NEGQTWNSIEIPEEYLGNLWVFDNELHINCRGNIYKLDYETQYWINIIQDNDFYIDELFIKDSIIIITGFQGNWVSTNSGQSWPQLPPHVNIGQKIIFSDDKFYINSGYYGFIHSSDAGKNWKVLPVPENSPYMIDIATVKGQILYNKCP